MDTHTGQVTLDEGGLRANHQPGVQLKHGRDHLTLPVKKCSREGQLMSRQVRMKRCWTDPVGCEQANKLIAPARARARLGAAS
jgi:hypothetical protein